MVETQTEESLEGTNPFFDTSEELENLAEMSMAEMVIKNQ